MDLAFLTRLVSLAILVLPAAYGAPSSLSSFISAPPSLSTITIQGQKFVVDPANYVLDGTTVRPGSAGIAIDGQVVSADAAHDLFVDGREILAEPTSSIAISTTAINQTSSLNSSNAVLPGSVSMSSFAAAAAASEFNVPGGNIAHIAVQAASTHTKYAVGDVSNTSRSASISATTVFSSGSAPLQSATISSAPFAVTSFSLSTASTAGTFANIQANNSRLQSRSTVSVSMSASTPEINLIPTSSLINSNSSSRFVAIAGVSKGSQSASSSPHSMGSTETTSRSPKTLPGAQSNTVTTGPTIAIPAIYLNPTGSVASSQGLLLVGAIFGITEEAKTLSAIIKDDVPKVSFISKIGETGDDVLKFLDQIHNDEDLPSYKEACLDGASIFDIFEDLGCLKGAFDEVKSDLEDETPDVTKIQVIFDNIGDLAKNLEKEEDDDDDDDSRTSTSETSSQASETQDTTTRNPSTSINITSSVTSASAKTSASETNSEASKTQNNTTENPSTSINITSSVTSASSSRVSSSSSTANATKQFFIDNPIVDPDTSDYSIPGVSDEAFMAFIGDVLYSAVGIGPGPSGFAVVIGNATANSSSSAAVDQSVSPSMNSSVSKSSIAVANALADEIADIAYQIAKSESVASSRTFITDTVPASTALSASVAHSAPSLAALTTASTQSSSNFLTSSTVPAPYQTPELLQPLMCTLL